MHYLNPIEFLKTIYYGDRYCTAFVVDEINKIIEIHINLISRIRNKSGHWNYYSDEDIENGILVITNVKEVCMDKSGLMPNDQIYDIYAKQVDEKNYEFTIETSYIDEDARTHDLFIKVIGQGVYITDPTNLEIKILS